jgi:hypothetical protein
MQPSKTCLTPIIKEPFICFQVIGGGFNRKPYYLSSISITVIRVPYYLILHPNPAVKNKVSYEQKSIGKTALFCSDDSGLRNYILQHHLGKA